MVNPTVFSIGPVNVYAYGLSLAASLILGLIISLRHARLLGVDPKVALDFVAAEALTAFFGARLAHVLWYWQYYAAEPLEIWHLSGDGLSSVGGILAGIGVGVWFARKRAVSFWRLADCIAPALALGRAIVFLGSDLLYEVTLLALSANYLIFWDLWNRRGSSTFPGELFGRFIMFSGGLHFLLGVAEAQEIWPDILQGWPGLAVAFAASFIIRKCRNTVSREEDVVKYPRIRPVSGIMGFLTFLAVYVLRLTERLG